MQRRFFIPAVAAAAGSAAMSAGTRDTIRREAARLAEFPGQQIPEASPELLDNAARIAEGTVFFYGSIPVPVGLREIDWKGGHLRHQEWPAQLNRFFHLAPLAAAYRALRDERFARAARAYLEDWLREDPYATATALRPGDNTLNMSIRLGSSVHGGWGAAIPLFLDSPAFDDAFLDRLLASMEHQAVFLSRHLTAAGNWRISQLDALVFTGIRFPFLGAVQTLRPVALDGLRTALATQFLPDGVHLERTPGYADWMTRVAANYASLAKIEPGCDVAVDRRRLVRSLDYNAHSQLFGVNDSTAPARDPGELSGLAARRATLARLGLSAPPDPPLDQVFASAGQVFLRSEWKPGADYVAFDSSTWGGGHSHLSRLSFAFRSGGRMLVADPGILTYEMSDPFGPYGKSTAAHSTLTLGGFNQSGADAQLLDTAFTPEAALIHARYQGGYWPGTFGWRFASGRGQGHYGAHSRVLFWVKRDYLAVFDTMEADPEAEIRNNWQLGPMEQWRFDAEAREWWSENRDVNLVLKLAVAPPGVTMSCVAGSRDPLRGWVGAHGHDAVPAPHLEFRYRAPAPAASVTLLKSYPAGPKPSLRVTRGAPEGASALRTYTVQMAGGITDYFAWSPGLTLPVDDGNPFVTDGRFVWLRTSEKGRVTAHFALGATFLRFRNRTIA